VRKIQKISSFLTREKVSALKIMVQCVMEDHITPSIFFLEEKKIGYTINVILKIAFTLIQLSRIALES